MLGRMDGLHMHQVYGHTEHRLLYATIDRVLLA